MRDGNQAIPIIRTKLYRPQVGPELVEREGLHERFKRGLDLPLTLVSAPAGYGKSVAVAQWLESSDVPSAWVSLDEGDAEMLVFLEYFIAAVQTLFPDACSDTLNLVEGMELPPVATLTATLTNDLAAVETPFILVLDDYYRLIDSKVHELIEALLNHPPRSLHLIIISRHNPPLSLASLRAKGRMIGVRLQDLEFSQADATTLLERAAGEPLDSQALDHVFSRTEGWAVGLCLAVMAMRYHDDKNAFLLGFGGDVRQVQDYMIAEVFEREDPAIRDCLCRISILDRFCAPLCTAVCGSVGNAKDGDSPEDFFSALLERTGLLIINQDSKRQWFRFHHLFQQLLVRQLESRFKETEIAGMHARAAVWLEANGFLEEAAQHLVKTDDAQAMRELILRNRRVLYRREKWLRLDALMNTLPAEVTNDDPDLLMIKSWIGIIRQRHTEIWGFVARTEELLKDQTCDDGLRHVFGQLDILLSWRSYASADGVTALACAQSAVDRLPLSFDIERGYARVMVAVCLQMVGRESEGIKYIYDALENDRQAHPTYRVRLLEALGFVLWMAGDLVGLRDAGAAMIRLGEKESLPVTIYNGHYQKGKALYAMGELEQTRKLLSTVIKPGYRATDRFLIRATYVLSMTYESLGQSDRASELLKNMIGHLLDDANSFSLAMVKAFQAELALRQGRLADAENWLATFEPSPMPRGDVTSNDELTAVKILLRRGTSASLREAGELLETYRVYFEQIHNTRFLIETLALQALFNQARSDAPRAVACLEQAIALALPRGFIRVFVDLGPDMSRLLNRLKVDEESLRFVGRLQAAFRAPIGKTVKANGTDTTKAVGISQSHHLIDPLTKREQEVLVLLSGSTSNMEIAAHLGISPGTVKRHTNSIYSKLAVHGRREAVAKATGLGLLG